MVLQLLVLIRRQALVEPWARLCVLIHVRVFLYYFWPPLLDGPAQALPVLAPLLFPLALLGSGLGAHFTLAKSVATLL